ncbi:MAG: outer membrane protein transport protein [Verrucomicrobiota bacterium]
MNYRRIFSLLVFTATAAATHASGVRIPHQDAAATARADAFVATADNPSAIFYNPAGITQLEGVQTRLGIYTVTLDVEHRPESGGSYGNKERAINIPTFYTTWSPPNEPISLGFGIDAPFGLSLEYDDKAPSRNKNKKARLVVVAFAPVVAWQLTPTLSIGAGPTINYGQAQDIRGIAVPGDGFRFQGDGTTYGFNAGILWKPSPKHAFGLTYHSALDFDFSGHSQVTVKPFPNSNRKLRFPQEDANLSVHLPQFIVAGYSFRPTPQWNLEVNVDWTDWDSLNTAPLNQQLSPAGGLDFHYTSGFIYEAGVTRSFSNGFQASAGYAFSENNAPASTFTPGIPDGDRHVFSAGIGGRGAHWDWDLGYQYSFTNFRTINNNGPADGKWRLHTNAVMLSVGYRF